MTTIDRLDPFSTAPRKRVFKRDESNNTQLPGLSTSAIKYEGKADTSLPFSVYMTNIFWTTNVPEIISNQSVDETFINDPPSKNSTVKASIPEELEEGLSNLISGIADESFKDIFEGNLAKSLSRIFNYYGEIAFNVLYNWLVSKPVDATAIKEMLVLIGRINVADKKARRNFLELCLQVNPQVNLSARIRYSAILGLSYLDDPESIPSVKSAIESEPLESLRKNMKQLLTQLEKTLLGK